MACLPQQEGLVKKIDKATVQAEVIAKDVQLVDVRTPAEYDQGHIDDAVNFDVSDTETFSTQIENLDKDRPIYVYCKKGGRSNKAAEILKTKGFTQIYDYSGGYDDWKKVE
jgi:rhodanese-related sulfurtransferase